MTVQTPEKQVYSEADVQKAISAIKDNEYRSIRKAALAFNVPNTTLQGRLSGRKSRATGHETEQVLSAAEEKTLSRWIARLTRTVFPASPALAIEMAEEIRPGRVQLHRCTTIKLSIPPLEVLDDPCTRTVNARIPRRIPHDVFSSYSTSPA